MQVVRLILGGLDTNCYLVNNACGTLVIDPAADAQSILDAAQERGWTIDAVAFTHRHFDHIMAADDLPVDKVHLHKEDERLYLKAEYNMSGRFGESFNGKKPRVFLSDGDEFMGFTVIHTPGHTPGGISFYSKEDGVLFSGDTLFNRGYGRTDFPGGSMMMLRQSLVRLLALPEETKVYPGHGNDTDIAQERRNLGWRG